MILLGIFFYFFKLFVPFVAAGLFDPLELELRLLRRSDFTLDLRELLELVEEILARLALNI